MASLQHIKHGWQTGYRLRVSHEGKRHSVWLGPVREREAVAVRLHVEAIQQSQRLRTPMPAETQRWLRATTLKPKLSFLLGLDKTVDEAVEEYIARETAINKATTVRAKEDTLNQFASHYGTLSMRSLTGDQIDTWLARQNVVASTIGKHVKQLRAWLKWCLDEQLVDSMITIKSPSTVGVGAKQFVDVGMIQKVIDHFAGDPRCNVYSRWPGGADCEWPVNWSRYADPASTSRQSDCTSKTPSDHIDNHAVHR